MRVLDFGPANDDRVDYLILRMELLVRLRQAEADRGVLFAGH